MYNITQFVEQQRKALEAGDIKDAKNHLTELESYVVKRHAWQTLRICLVKWCKSIQGSMSDQH
jgi:hypothetical protein